MAHQTTTITVIPAALAAAVQALIPTATSLEALEIRHLFHRLKGAVVEAPMVYLLMVVVVAVVPVQLARMEQLVHQEVAVRERHRQLAAHQ